MCLSLEDEDSAKKQAQPSQLHWMQSATEPRIVFEALDLFDYSNNGDRTGGAVSGSPDQSPSPYYSEKNQKGGVYLSEYLMPE
jgi:hypothetical protein